MNCSRTVLGTSVVDRIKKRDVRESTVTQNVSWWLGNTEVVEIRGTQEWRKGESKGEIVGIS